MSKIAVLVTCHNRKDVTLACISRLFELKTDVEVFCVDDNSSDGTFETLKEQLPQVHLFKGDGNLFWCGGMRKAWVEARSYFDYDYYIWLNDDLFLYENAIEELLECNKMFDLAIIGGLVQEETTGAAIYGGFDKKQYIIEATGELNPIYRLNGNFVLVPKNVFEKLGYFDSMYHHDIGDVDYSFMAHEANIPVLSTRCYIGSTKACLKSNLLRIRNGKGLIGRFKKLYSPLGAPPQIHFHFIKKHKGLVAACGYYCYLHIINIMPDFFWNIIENRIYK